MPPALQQLHHLGIATANISEATAFVRRAFAVTGQDGPMFDPKLNVEVVLLFVKDSAAIELVSGAPVSGVLKRRVLLYHCCYEVESLEAQLSRLKDDGALIVVPPTPAVLFNGRRVAFVHTKIGLMELLEAE